MTSAEGKKKDGSAEDKPEKLQVKNKNSMRERRNKNKKQIK